LNMKSIAIDRKNVIQTTSPDRQVQDVRANKPVAQSQPASTLKSIPASPRPVALTSQQMLISAQRELEIARKLRMQAQKYLQDTEMKARSEAQRLLLQTRLAVRKETQELMQQATEEIQKILADIRVIRITAQEELAAQKKFTDAARLRSFTLSLQKDEFEPEENKVKKPARKKQAVH
jgi:vacuolar-type H+-ATPase subunit H